MTIYYSKVFEQLDKNVYDVNPANYIGTYKLFGKFNIPTPDPWNDEWFHVNMVKKVTNTRFGDQPLWGDGEATLDPGVIKAKWLSWSYTLTEKQMHSLMDNPTGHFAQLVAAGIRGQQSRFATELDDYLIGYLYGTTTDQDYDKSYIPLLKLRNTTTETVDDPQDCSATAGTNTDLSAVQFTGAAQTVGNVDASFGITKGLFYQKYDSTTRESMFHKDGSDTFHAFAHPAAWQKIFGGYESNAAGELDYSMNYKKLIEERGITPVSTYAVDAAYDGASTTAAEIVMTMNTAENFQVAEIVPYTVEPWKEYNDPQRGIIFRKRAYMKFLPWRVPYYIGGAICKAMAAFRVQPYANA